MRIKNSGLDGPREVPRREPRLTLADELFVTRAPEAAAQPVAMRLLMRVRSQPVPVPPRHRGLALPLLTRERGGFLAVPPHPPRSGAASGARIFPGGA